MISKTVLTRLLIALLGLGLWSAATLATGTEYQLGVDGLACPFCAFGIEKKLSTLPGIADTRVDLKKGLVIVTMKHGARLSEASARAKVKAAGFTLRSFDAPAPAGQ